VRTGPGAAAQNTCRVASSGAAAVPRSSARSGPPSRAAAGFKAAFARGVGSTADRYAYGRVLATLGQHDAAIVQFSRAAQSASLAGRARYQRARSLLRSGRLAELRAVVRGDYDLASSASALFLLADLATDEGRDPAARAAFRDIVRRYPASTLAPPAAFPAGIIAFAHDSVATSAREFDALRARHYCDNSVSTRTLDVSTTVWSGTRDVHSTGSFPRRQRSNPQQWWTDDTTRDGSAEVDSPTGRDALSPGVSTTV
jgi:TolA-binding protein